ncbi:MAG: sugar phosphate isomerase/epimerase family protein [Micrococcaceae bacterium]
MTRLLSTAHLTALQLSPPELVQRAAHHGFEAVGVRVHPATATETRYPMQPGSPMVRETRDAIEQTGVQVLDLEVFGLAEHIGPDHWTPVLETGAQLGASVLNVVGVDPDLNRFRDKLGELVATARDYGIRPCMEPISYQPLSSFNTARRFAEETGAGLMLDTLHVFRSGTTVAQLAEIPAEHIAVVQLCDGAWKEPSVVDDSVVLPLGQSVGGSPRQYEARVHRLLPGEGEFPLVEVLRLFPEAPVSVEVPDARAVEADGLDAHLARCIAATRELISSAAAAPIPDR